MFNICSQFRTVDWIIAATGGGDGDLVGDEGGGFIVDVVSVAVVVLFSSPLRRAASQVAASTCLQSVGPSIEIRKLFAFNFVEWRRNWKIFSYFHYFSVFSSISAAFLKSGEQH